mmetsp:Transcript_16306/g.42889  ORF Transcript_16306/g.42889 Transcript_16306/m.42889 type:complete len:321 (+) Transcript_16306:1593-2555(+)
MLKTAMASTMSLQASSSMSEKMSRLRRERSMRPRSFGLSICRNLSRLISKGVGSKVPLLGECMTKTSVRSSSLFLLPKAVGSRMRSGRRVVGDRSLLFADPPPLPFSSPGTDLRKDVGMRPREGRLLKLGWLSSLMDSGSDSLTASANLMLELRERPETEKSGSSSSSSSPPDGRGAGAAETPAAADSLCCLSASARARFSSIKKSVSMSTPSSPAGAAAAAAAASRCRLSSKARCRFSSMRRRTSSGSAELADADELFAGAGSSFGPFLYAKRSKCSLSRGSESKPSSSFSFSCRTVRVFQTMSSKWSPNGYKSLNHRS